MDPFVLYGYIQKLKTGKPNQDLDKTSLDFLGHFAWKKSVSSYQIYSYLKFTILKMAYKNVNKRINALFTSGLIEVDANRVGIKHKAKYYRLTEHGIYQLFLKNLTSLLFNQSDIRRGKKPSANASVFFDNYSNSQLFEVFLYPYFKKETLFAIRDLLLWDLFHYLSNCCHSIEANLKSVKINDIPIGEKVFSWNKVPGDDNEFLLLHLRQLFNIENIEQNGIVKEDTVDGDQPTITVSTSSAPILIKLDTNNNKVIIASNIGKEGVQLFHYDVHQIGNEMVVSHKLPKEDSTKPLAIESEKQIHHLIYEFVSELASSPADSEYSYCYDVLSRDKKFMKVVKEIYEKRQCFERGYKLLSR